MQSVPHQSRTSHNPASSFPQPFDHHTSWSAPLWNTQFLIAGVLLVRILVLSTASDLFKSSVASASAIPPEVTAAITSLVAMSVVPSNIGHGRGLPTSDTWKMALPATPAPPPLYHTQWLPSPPHSFPEFYDNPRHEFCGCSSPRSSGHRGSSTAMEGEFGAKLLEHAFSQLQQDQAAFAIRESHSYHNRSRISTIASSKASKKQHRSRAAAMRPPALVATHPTLYRQTESKPPAIMDSKQPSPEAKPIIKVEKQSSVRKIVSLPIPCQEGKPQPAHPPPSRHPFTDARRLLSHDTKFDDPRPRYLKIDLASTHPVVISPVPMIALPFGDIMEAAHVYSKDSSTTKD
ncbi:hypothetical protein HII31_07899 [Pseudocercospora fuligena]|uniref:Uncharacterized protein n=1 Tax=Pseudocercospora fuligena TaxID=685502 RepID=A0A8H6RF78_9PEZI|nr:hypothetical protein HII31_07899 [Pseudocercospora fuligena]